MGKLVVYFSVSGRTKAAAKALAKAAGADLKEIVPAVPYTTADLDWRDKQSRSTREMTDESSRPEIVDATCDLSGYDTVYIGFPIWWGVAPRPVNTFVEANDLAGKRVVLFATSGGSGIGHAAMAFKKAYPDLDVVASKMLNGPVTEDII
jgi:hypothetical protein